MISIWGRKCTLTEKFGALLHVAHGMELTRSHQENKRSLLKIFYVTPFQHLKEHRSVASNITVLHDPLLILESRASPIVPGMALTLVYPRSLAKFAYVAESKANLWALAID